MKWNYDAESLAEAVGMAQEELEEWASQAARIMGRYGLVLKRKGRPAERLEALFQGLVEEFGMDPASALKVAMMLDIIASQPSFTIIQLFPGNGASGDEGNTLH